LQDVNIFSFNLIAIESNSPSLRPEEAANITGKMLGHKLITKQTSKEGVPVSKVLLLLLSFGTEKKIKGDDLRISDFQQRILFCHLNGQKLSRTSDGCFS
jgi:hypothetical protein